ncbi:MAG: tetratricopeptide repeat protein [Candidatus Magnetomorum sp.]|nr:tetratricopeptide repeat protein [Candidatus Magnetomorum sp.]
MPDLFNPKSCKIPKETIEFLFQKGLFYKSTHQYTDAVSCFQEMLLIQADHIDAINNLGATFKEMGQKQDAQACFFKALNLQPNYPPAHANLALLFLDKKKYQLAFDHAQRAYNNFQSNAVFLFHYGLILEKLNHLPDAAIQYEKAVLIDPNYFAPANNLSIIKILMGDLIDAENLLLDCIKRFPERYKPLINLGLCYEEQGEIQKAIDYYEKAAFMENTDTLTRSNFLFSLHYHPECNANLLYKYHLKWCVYPNLNKYKQTKNNFDQDQNPINIGYLSPDFRTHPVASFLHPILLNHDKRQFQIICYAHINSADAMTEKIKSLSTKWVDISSMSDDAVCQKIQKDRIHILVDLAGHSKNNRLGIFAMKPAPIQVSYLGYPGTTGLDQIDYRITDQWADPKEFEPFYTETLARMPQCFLCYHPEYQTPEVSCLPALNNGFITLGSFTRMSKVNPYLLEIWAKMLTCLPNSRLILKAQAFHDPLISKRILTFFEKKGIDTHRLTVLERTPSRLEHLKLYHQIDIALDTFPYHGTTTTCQALWMGVPVITLQGQAHVSRVSVSILNTLGLNDCIAQTSEEYIEKVICLSENIHFLTQLRQNLRAIVQQSPLHQSEKFITDLEQLYRWMWHQYNH